MKITYKVVDNGPSSGYVTAEGWEHLRVPIKWNKPENKSQLVEMAKYAIPEKLNEKPKPRQPETVNRS